MSSWVKMAKPILQAMSFHFVTDDTQPVMKLPSQSPSLRMSGWLKGNISRVLRNMLLSSN